jgi:hypothetical protein
MVGLCKTLVKEKRLFYYLESSHKIFYTTLVTQTFLVAMTVHGLKERITIQ